MYAVVRESTCSTPAPRDTIVPSSRYTVYCSRSLWQRWGECKLSICVLRVDVYGWTAPLIEMKTLIGGKSGRAQVHISAGSHWSYLSPSFVFLPSPVLMSLRRRPSPLSSATQPSISDCVSDVIFGNSAAASCGARSTATPIAAAWNRPRREIVVGAISRVTDDIPLRIVGACAGRDMRKAPTP